MNNSIASGILGVPILLIIKLDTELMLLLSSYSLVKGKGKEKM